MNVDHILNQTLSFVTPQMHKERRKSLKCSISSLLHGADLSVTSLGRNTQRETAEKHQIKRSDRLCGNTKLHAELPSIYKALCLQLVGTQKHPVILVDWSDLDARQENFLIRAAIAVDGRSLTLYEETHPLAKKEKPATHKAFMKTLKSMLPDDCRPIIVSDAGFKNPWFKLVQSLGWDYVGRVRGRSMCTQDDNEWSRVKTLYDTASSRPKLLGKWTIAKSNPLDSNLVVYKGLAKGRKDLIAKGNRSRRSSKSRSSADREKEPWLLATSFDTQAKGLAKKVVRIYRTRMQIEESFRDMKTGLNMNAGNSRIICRIQVLMLIALIAQYVLMLIGLAIVLSGKHRTYQANSIKHRAVLSYQFLALRAVNKRRFTIDADAWQRTKERLNQLMLEPLNG